MSVPLALLLTNLNENKKLIKTWDSERELFYEDIRHVLQSTIDLRQN